MKMSTHSSAVGVVLLASALAGCVNQDEPLDDLGGELGGELGETQAALTGTYDTCTKDFYMQADYGAGFYTMKPDGSIWVSGAHRPAERMVEIGTDNKEFVKNSGQGVAVCVIKNDDSLWCWGNNDDGVVGTGTVDRVTEPYKTLEGVEEAQLSRYWGCALKLDGTVWCWGNVLETHMIGDGTIDDVAPGSYEVHAPTQVTLPGPAREVTVGFTHALAILRDGRVFGWGVSGGYCLGLGTIEGYPTPVEAPMFGTDNTHITSGSLSTGILKEDGRVFTLGYANAVDVTPIQPLMTLHEVTEIGADVVKYDTSMHHACALKPDGSLWCWGDENWDAQLGNNSLDVEEVVLTPRILNGMFDGSGSPVVNFKMVKSQTCALLEDNSLWCLGGGGFPDGVQDDDVPILTATEQDWCNLCDVTTCSMACVLGECVACTYDDQCKLPGNSFCDIDTGLCVAEDPNPGANAGVSGCGGGARCTATPGRGPARFGSWLILLGAVAAAFVIRRHARRR